MSFSVETEVGYAVPATAALGGALTTSWGRRRRRGAVSADPGAASIHGSFLLTASGAIGSTVAIQLHQFGDGDRRGRSPWSSSAHPTIRSARFDEVGIGAPQVSIGDVVVVEGSSGTWTPVRGDLVAVRPPRT